VKATVFGSHIAAPTMTLEEYGDLQKIEAEARSRDSQTTSQGELMSRRYYSLCMYACMYVYMYVCMYVWLYVCVYVFVCMHVYVCIYVRMYVCMYVCIYACVCTYVYMRV